MSELTEDSATLLVGSKPSRYRAFILNADETVLRIEHLPAHDDDMALDLARKLLDGHALELWDGMRFIEHLDPGASAS